MSGREARATLREAGIGDRHARELLASDLVGAHRRRGSALLYEQAAIQSLATRPVRSQRDLCEVSPLGWFVARRPDAANAGSRADQLETLAGGWHGMSVFTVVGLRVHLEQQGPLPFLATVGSCVYLGADLQDVRVDGRLVLTEPDRWFERFRDARLPTGPGRPWHLRASTMRWLRPRAD